MKVNFIFSRLLALMMLVLGMQEVYAGSDSDSDIVGALYVGTNDPVANGVLMFQRHRDGTLTQVPGSPFLTGGQGTGTGVEFAVDPMGSAGSVIVDEKNKFLFIVNAGSNDVSVFKIHRDRLTLVETVSTQGSFPNSLTVKNNVLYVLNSANTFSFTGFKVSKSGHLTPLKDTPCYLLPPLNQAPIIGDGQPLVSIVPAQISFTPNGKQLVISRKEGILSLEPLILAGPGRIDVYKLDKCGRVVDCDNPTSNINNRVPFGRFPFGFIFSKQGDLIMTEAAAVPPTPPSTASGVSTYKVKSNGKLEVISADVPNGQFATCWAAQSGKYVYTSNNLSNSISLYQIHKDGTLKLINGQIVVLGTEEVPAFPLDMATSCDGRFLYQLSEGVDAVIYVFAINKRSGDLTLIETVSVGASFAGQAGLALANFK